MPDTCELHGMRAVCFGSSGCKFNSGRCKETSLKPKSCGTGNVNALSKIICDGKSAENCPQLEGMFAYMYNYGNSECGVAKGSHCVSGKDFVSSPETPYHAFCVLEI